MSNHAYFMQRALSLAEQGRFTARPNPNVGCVIVKNGSIVGEGWHIKPGTPHAEIHALRQAGDQAVGADLYVNLEPCSHTGRTPPCADALINAKIKRLIIPFIDPNPLVNGIGLHRLRAAGIEVIDGIEVERAAELNRFFLKAMLTRQPYVIAKWAMTLDGQLNWSDSSRRWISCENARHHAHQQRAQVDAILVGAETWRVDRPQLTARLPDVDHALIKQPRRLVLSSTGQIEPTWLEKVTGDLWIVTTTLNKNLPQFPHIHYLYLPHPEYSGQVDLAKLLDWLFQEACFSLLVEGGARTLAHFFKSDRIDEFHLYQRVLHSGFTDRSGIPFFHKQENWSIKEVQQIDQTIFVKGIKNAKIN